MKVSIIPGNTFIRKVKQLAKKYRSIEADLKNLVEDLKANPHSGSDLGNGFRKVRLSIASKGRGKSGGARVITYQIIVSVEEEKIILLTIYDKSEQESISDKELKQLISKL